MSIVNINNSQTAKCQIEIGVPPFDNHQQSSWQVDAVVGTNWQHNWLPNSDWSIVVANPTRLFHLFSDQILQHLSWYILADAQCMLSDHCLPLLSILTIWSFHVGFGLRIRKHQQTVVQLSVICNQLKCPCQPIGCLIRRTLWRTFI